MPIIIEDLDLDMAAVGTVAKELTPKFFSSDLTGNGRNSRGLLHQLLLPTISASQIGKAAQIDTIAMKHSSTQNGVTRQVIPFAPLTRGALTEPDVPFTLPVALPENRCEVKTVALSSHQNPLNSHSVYFAMTPQGAHHYESKDSNNVTIRDFIVQYRMELFVMAPTPTEPERVQNINTVANFNDSFVALDWECDPMDKAIAFISSTLGRLGLGVAKPDEIDAWLSTDYNIHDHIVAQANLWDSTGVSEEVVHYINALPADADGPKLNTLALQLRYLENYNVPLEAYREVHQAIEAKFDEQTAAALSKQNLNLLMSHTLSHLDAMRDQLTTPPVPAGGKPVVPSHFSIQQKEALSTHEPLVMTQAGAGTGKSTVILGRIAYLESCGVPASDVTVLSFTNAAADNIVARNPNVGSMTIARMINDIYRENFTHELSSIDTIINSLDIFFATDGFAVAFRQRLWEVQKNKLGAFTALNTFIETNLERVLQVLNQINQTTLELEIILCYQLIDHLKEPAHVASRYLIIDEVQDNSIFEFIYVLKYITKHKESLFIVGDASQTLYEFRSANPRALNTLEGSGVFATFKLTTNYRSNQEILDFANVVLGDLETNQLAKIQLEANSLVVPTEDSFRQKVTLDYRLVSKLDKFITEELAGIMSVTVKNDYVDACLARGEQVAFLAYSRREIAIIEQVMREAYPQAKIGNLISERSYATDIFSKYIKEFWNDVLVSDPHNASFVIAQGIKNNMHTLARNAQNPAAQNAITKMVSEWWIANAPTIQGWVQLCSSGHMSHQQFFDDLRDNLLKFEISKNSVRQSLVNERNRARKQEHADVKPDIVLSTIHGAKGMEFDNVVVIHKDGNDTSQEYKRMFYVAFTRAMKSMYVLSYGKLKNPVMVSNYEQIIGALQARDKATAAKAKIDALVSMGYDRDMIDENGDLISSPAPADSEDTAPARA